MSLVSFTTQRTSPLTLIEGTKTDGQCWSSLVADLLARALVESQRFKKVLLISFDRQASDIRASCTQGGEEDAHISKDVEVLQAFDVLTGDSPLDQFFEGIIDKCAAYVSSESSEDKNATSGDAPASEGSLGIVIYSVTSLILSHGRSKVLKSLKRLTSSLSSGTDIKGTVIGTIYSSLHSEKEIALLRDFADTYCQLTPNRGSLSSVVAVEGHCIRRGATTMSGGGGGRVSEVRDMFSFEDPSIAAIQQARHRGKMGQGEGHRLWVPHRLKALPKVKSDGEAGLAEDEITEEHADSAENVLQSMVPKEATSLAAEVAKKSSGEQSTDKMSMIAARHLVTFNSTDPEFDEDSDPDADLDL